MSNALMAALETASENGAEGQTSTQVEGKKYSQKSMPVYKHTNITKQDFDALKSVANDGTGRKSVYDFTSEEKRKTEAWARSFYEELGVKSPFFRAFFGEWRLNSTEPVKVVTEKGRDIGDRVNADTGWTINIGKQVYRETDAHKSNNSVIALPMLDYIDEIVENAVLVDSQVSTKKDGYSTFYHILYVYVDNGNDTNLVKLTVEQIDDYDGNNLIHRAYKLSNMEVTPNAGSALQADKAKGVTTYSISDLFKAVKKIDKSYHPKKSSLVLNEDGSPKVVYHGTLANNITEFRKDYIGSRYAADDVGFFFTDNKALASDYAMSEFDSSKWGVVIPAYLSIQKPLVFDASYAKANGYGNVFKNNDVVDVWDNYQAAIRCTCNGCARIARTAKGWTNP